MIDAQQPVDKRVEITSHPARMGGGFWVRDINGPFAVYRAHFADADAIRRVFTMLIKRYHAGEGFGRNHEAFRRKSVDLARQLTEDPNAAERRHVANRRAEDVTSKVVEVGTAYEES